MSSVRSSNTKPEILVRKMLHAEGLRFRLHRKDLPGSPDVVLPKFSTAVFVHGCFWHSHDCDRFSLPQTNREFWKEKLEGNLRRDQIAVSALESLGWRVRVIWACSIEAGVSALIAELNSQSPRVG